MMLNWLRRHLERIRIGTEGLAEINEVLIKMGRRQNYDLLHAIDYINEYAHLSNDAYAKGFAGRLRRRCENYRQAFLFGDIGKNYVSGLHKTIDKLEDDREKFIKLCDEHGIDHSEITGQDIPF